MIPTLDPTAGALLRITPTVEHDRVILALIGEIDITNADQLLCAPAGIHIAELIGIVGLTEHLTDPAWPLV